ncbi:cation-translocating P-type ATPase C-terminal domain-containing protein [Porticoccaceae bacterium]|nr:cation-translocating P-type ATPase C-terminal domain-containing protein [Porticoccaceae bacterium]
MPLTAVQLLWLNLVTSGVQHIGLAMEPGEGDEMQKPPRRPSEALFNPLMIKRVLLSALVVGATSFCCFAYLIYLGWGEISARNSTLLLMVLFENIQVLNSRSESRSILRHPLWTNPTLIVATLAAQGIHIASMYWPVMQRVLSTTPVTLAHWSSLLLAACSILLVIELDKLLTRLTLKTANTASKVA